MSLQGQPNAEPPTNLLDTIKTTRADAGEALNDDELTRLLREYPLPVEAGFAFLTFSDGCVTLSVPHQNPADWYPQQGWIAPDKERIAKMIAETCGLQLYEPVDVTSIVQNHHAGSIAHHHFEFTDSRQTVIVAHPLYLKVRLFGKSPDHRYAWEAPCQLPLAPNLLQDFSPLYEKQNKRRKPATDTLKPSEIPARRGADEILRPANGLPRGLDDWLHAECVPLAGGACPIGSNDQAGAADKCRNHQRFP